MRTFKPPCGFTLTLIWFYSGDCELVTPQRRVKPADRTCVWNVLFPAMYMKGIFKKKVAAVTA